MVLSGIISVVIQDCNAIGRIQMNASRGERYRPDRVVIQKIKQVKFDRRKTETIQNKFVYLVTLKGVTSIW